ncbi:hypothetical protein ZWY2020_051235 [Hordeum vulgare]|nr:hypothetical protein ZWY2020_051235 [Hordeum vulgare]
MRLSQPAVEFTSVEEKRLFPEALSRPRAFTFGKVVYLAHFAGARVQSFPADQTTIHNFCAHLAALSLDPSSLTIPVYLLPRSTEALASGRDWTVPVDAPAQMWSLHVGNTFEEDNCRGGLDLHLHMSGYS